jgi:hypothetical protein
MISTPPSLHPTSRDVLWLVPGLLLACGGGALGVLFVAAAALRPAPAAGGGPSLALFGVAFAGAGALLGLPLVAAGLRAARGAPPRAFGLGPWWLWVALWFPVAALGEWQARTRPDGGAFGVLHVLAMALPPLALAAWLARHAAMRDVRWTTGWSHLVSGAVLATFVALVLELVGGALLLAVVFVPAAVLDPGVTPRLQELFAALRDAANQGESLPLSYWEGYLNWWPVQIYLPLLLSVLVPLIEEFSKPASVLAHLAWRRASVPPALAFRFGALAGAGFALLEGVLNGTAAAGPDWWQVALLRAAATVMHACGAALVAWGAAEFAWSRRGRRWLGVLALALCLHAAWNGITIALSGVPDGDWLAVVGFAGLGGLTALALGVLWWGALRLSLAPGDVVPDAVAQPPQGQPGEPAPAEVLLAVGPASEIKLTGGGTDEP